MPVRISRRPKPESPISTSLLVTPSTCQLIGYARVSTDEQIMDMQVNALRAAGCVMIFEEKVSGAAKKRPQLDLAIKGLQPDDTLMVWKLDRLGRNVRELFRRVDQIREAGAIFRSLTEALDFGTPTGEMMMTVMGAFAQFERDMVIFRTKPGMAAARLRGSQIGAPIKFTAQKKAKAREWLSPRGNPQKPAVIARRLGLSLGTISIWIKAGMP